VKAHRCLVGISMVAYAHLQLSSAPAHSTPTVTCPTTIAQSGPEASFRCKATVLERLQREIDVTPRIAHSEYVEAYEELFGNSFDAENVGSLTSSERKQLLRFAAIASWRSSKVRYAHHMLMVSQTQLEKNEASEEERQLTYHELISYRKFDIAYGFAKQAGLDVPRFEIIELVTDPQGSPTALYITEERHRFERREVDLNHGPRIVVSSSPGCAFCVKAATAISADTWLNDVFRAHSEWMEPTHTLLNYDHLHAWQQRYPSLRVSAMYDVAEWPSSMATSVRGTPTFHFFLDGKLEDTMTGWPDDAKERIQRCLENIGISLR